MFVLHGYVCAPPQVMPIKEHSKQTVFAPARFGQMLDWQQRLLTLTQQDVTTRRTAMKALRDARRARSSAYANTRALDHALALAGSGLGRSMLQDGEVALRPVGEGERRYFAPWAGPWPFSVPAEHAALGCKAIIKTEADGKKHFELVEHIGNRPTLCLNIDQGSKGYAGTWFMAHALKLRVVTVCDSHHRAWNDVMDAVGACGMKHLIYEFLVVLNLPHGLWSGCAFWAQTQESFDSFIERSDINDDLFTLLYSRIAHDFGQAIRGARYSTFTALPA